jgi:hypothetical protein
MTEASRITYSPRPDATPEGELSALKAAYRFILDCHAKKEGGPYTAPNDRKGLENDPARTQHTR